MIVRVAAATLAIAAAAPASMSMAASTPLLVSMVGRTQLTTMETPTLVQDTGNPQYRTARQRLTAHRSDPTCAGCHQVIDPIGLALENFDGLGEFRQDENGAAIDASGDLDGFAFRDPAGLGQAMHDNPATASCLVQSTWRYAVGRKGGAGEADFVRYLEQRFARDGHRLTGLLRTIANSDAFYRIAPQTEEAAR